MGEKDQDSSSKWYLIITIAVVLLLVGAGWYAQCSSQGRIQYKQKGN